MSKAFRSKTRWQTKGSLNTWKSCKYTIEACENPTDRTSLPTMRVCVSPLKKKSHPRSKNTKKQNSYDSADKSCNTSSLSSTTSSKIMKLRKSLTTGTIAEGQRDVKVEEYIPDAPKTNKPVNSNGNGAKIKYIPSRKSALVNLQTSTDSNEYVPAVLNEDLAANSVLDTLYIPNSIPKAETSYETYEPSSSVEMESTRMYIPNSKSGRKKIEEYQPDFTSKTMKFDNSYVPSSSAKIKELKKSSRKPSLGSKKLKNRETDFGKTEVSSTKHSNLTNRSIKREI
ncbi:uncharacterized protein LOC105685414 isoform X2 [Athalia rosae]|uniref:uncharacterized protein LOC105685414 isoform X2 n=1 Tax=Athalia rosae TaxID=37344 RepID=UPI00203417AB|nr:uncharacterized protein LOC105685414 isoform X2 [Athalia rosae]